MIAAVVPFRGPHFARELLLQKLEAEVRGARRPPHVLDLMTEIHSAAITLLPVIQLLEIQA